MITSKIAKGNLLGLAIVFAVSCLHDTGITQSDLLAAKPKIESRDGAPQDPDNDGIDNAIDADDDNDGVLDVDEHPDCRERFNPSISWTDKNGEAYPCVNSEEPTCSQPDFDLDHIPDACDADADGDGENSFAYGGLDCEDMDPAIPSKTPCILSPGAGVPTGSASKPPDFDDDRIIDTEDNCPSKFNKKQRDADGDGLGDACDFCKTDTNNDPDRDAVCDDGDKSNTIGDNFCTTGVAIDCDDNCPSISNPNQADSNGDGEGDACDTDADGDGKISIYHGGDDCNDYDKTIYPGSADKDKDCDPFTSEADHYITFPGSSNFDGWLPKPGEVVTFDVVLNSSKPIVSGTWHVDVTPAAGGARDITHNAGEYFNDPDRNAGEDYTFVVNDTADPKKKAVTITCKDYAGSITIHAQVQVDESASSKPTVASKITFPKDSDEDELPDAWEIHFGDLIRDNDNDKDELTNFEEYWGFKWGPALVKVAPANSGGRYQSVAYVPQGNATYFRTDPTRPDLFGKVVGYDFNIASFTTWAIDAVHGYDETLCGECFFAIGEAYERVGVDVHVLSLNNLPQHMDADMAAGIASGVESWEKYIDAQGVEQHFIRTVKINNRLDSPMSGTDGHIDKRDVRSWRWDTKGWSGFGDDLAYGLGTTSYWISLYNYVHDLPYKDQPSATGGTTNNLLDPINLCEDKNDNGINDKIGHGPSAYWEAGCQTCNLDGDLYIPGSYSQTLSTFDIDKDLRVELPVKTDPSTLDPLSLDSDEYTIPQILKSTITHEWGHAIGAHENGDPFCIMYSISNNWKRDDRFSQYAIDEMRFHNH